MAKRRRNPATIHRDEDTVSDFDFFAGHPGDAPSSPEKPLQRNAANARERARMRVLSKAFVRLKTSLPWVPKDTKLSKLDTLRLAATYIAHLRKVLREDGEEDGCSSARECSTHPVTMSWPYTINSRSNYFDYTPPSSRQEHVQNAVDYNQSGVSLEYQNFASCEYLAMDQTNCQRRNTLTHYVQ